MCTQMASSHISRAINRPEDSYIVQTVLINVNGRWSVLIQSFYSLDDHLERFTIQVLPFTHLHTHVFSASMCSTFSMRRENLGVQYLAQGHFGKRNGEDWDRYIVFLCSSPKCLVTLNVRASTGSILKISRWEKEIIEVFRYFLLLRMEVMFSPLSVCWLVCLFVNKRTQKQLNGFPWNLVVRCSVGLGRNHSISVQIWIRGWRSGIYFSLCLTFFNIFTVLQRSNSWVCEGELLSGLLQPYGRSSERHCSLNVKISIYTFSNFKVVQ